MTTEQSEYYSGIGSLLPNPKAPSSLIHQQHNHHHLNSNKNEKKYMNTELKD
jgi:hypothetical protein